VRIPQSLIDEMVAHAREDAPNECCGMVGGRDGEATTVIRVENEFASPLRFRMEGQAQYDAWKRIEDAGDEILAIYHSHTKSRAYPSQTDVNESVMWPDQIQVIVSLEDPETPNVKGFWIRDGEISDAELEVG
jgi:proteasome lid subunit RPN8/RPN11